MPDLTVKLNMFFFNLSMETNPFSYVSVKSTLSVLNKSMLIDSRLEKLLGCMHLLHYLIQKVVQSTW